MKHRLIKSKEKDLTEIPLLTALGKRQPTKNAKFSMSTFQEKLLKVFKKVGERYSNPTKTLSPAF